MATIKEAVEIEDTRDMPAEYNMMNLFVEGSFFRAYEWSAWLCYNHMSHFKILHRHFKGIDKSVIFLGFPRTSFKKWAKEGMELKQIDEKRYCVEIPVSSFNGSGYEEMKTQFDDWKNGIPLTVEPEKKEMPVKADPVSSSGSGNMQRVSIMGVMQQIITYPIEEKSPVDCANFLTNIRRQLISML